MEPNIINMDINSMYPSWIGGIHSFDDYRKYRQYAEGLLAEETIIPKEFLEEVNKMSEPYMNRYCDGGRDKDIHFLFETDNWNGNKIKDMTSSHIINSALMLIKKATEFKLNYELFIIDNSDNKLLVPKDNIEKIAELDAITWIKTTPIFIAFTKELAIRKLLQYFEITLNRLETNKGAED